MSDTNDNALSVVEQTIVNSLARVSPEFEKSILKNNYSLVADDQIEAAKRQVMKSDYAMQCVRNSPTHFEQAVLTASALGLDLTEGKKQGWLIPRSVKMTDTQGRKRDVPVIMFQPGYKGYEAIHQRLGVIKRLYVRAIRENDEFNWSGDDSEKPTHNANWFESEESRGDIIGAYCVTYFPDGDMQTVTAGIEEIYTKHRDKSDSWKTENGRKYSPWTHFPEQMVLKTMVYIAHKQWPAYKMSESGHASQVLETLHQADTADYENIKSQTDGRFEGFLMTNNAVGMYLLHKEYLAGHDNFDLDDKNGKAWVNLFRNLPEGFKGKVREQVNRLIEQGENMYLEIKESINNEDPATIELVDYMDRDCKRLLAKNLGKDMSEKLGDLVKGE